MYWGIHRGKHGLLRVGQLASTPWLMKELEQRPSFPIISLLQPCQLMCNNNRKYGGIRDLGTLYVWHWCPGGMEESTLEDPHAVHFERAQGRIWELEPFPALPLPHQTGRLNCSPTFILWLPFVLSKYSSDGWSEALPRRILEEDLLPQHSETFQVSTA